MTYPLMIVTDAMRGLLGHVLHGTELTRIALVGPTNAAVRDVLDWLDGRLDDRNRPHSLVRVPGRQSLITATGVSVWALPIDKPDRWRSHEFDVLAYVGERPTDEQLEAVAPAFLTPHRHESPDVAAACAPCQWRARAWSGEPVDDVSGGV